MTTIKHYETPGSIDPSLHYVGNMPSSVGLNMARETLLHDVWYRQHSQLLQYTGPPSSTFNGAYASDFYIIYPCLEPPGADEKIRLGVDCMCWDENLGGSLSVQWNGGTAYTPSVTSGAAQGPGESPAGIRMLLTDEIAYNLNAVTNNNAVYGYSQLTVDNAVVSHLSAFTVPRDSNAYRQDTPDANSFDQQFSIKNDAFNVDVPLIGCSSFDSINGSAGALCQHQNTLVKQRASLVSSTDQCVFQWGHPAGLYIPGDGNFNGIFGQPTINGNPYDMKVKVRGRALTSNSAKTLDLAVVARWESANCQIKVTADGGSTATYTFSGSNTGAPSLVVDDNFITFLPTGDDILIEAKTPAGEAMEIKTIALFERSIGDTV
jgi:hypothetical protein